MKILKYIFILLPFFGFGQSADGTFKTVTASGTNSYTISEVLKSPDAYDVKEKWIVIFTNGNTGAVTIERNHLGVKSLKKLDGTDFASGDIPAGSRFLVSYNGTYYQAIGASTSLAWGNITGSLSNQTDLQSALNAKQNTITFGTGVESALGVNIGSAGAPVLFNGAGGTPSSLTLTNATGLPASTGLTGIVPSTNGGAGTINGLLKANGGGTVIAATPRTDYTSSYPTVSSTASTASLTPDPTINDLYDITALAVGLTINNPSASGNGYAFVIRIKDNSTPRALTWDTQYRGVGGSLPTTTTASSTLYLPIIYNSADSKWDVSISSGASGTTNEIAYFSAPMIIGSLSTAVYPSLTELSYLKGVTSSIESRLGGWAVTGPTTLTGVSTISTTTPSGLQFLQNGWTATGNNQYGLKMTFNETSENVNNDVLDGLVVDGTLTGNAGGPTGQTANFFRLNAIFAGGIPNTNIFKMQVSGTDIYTFASGGAAFTKSSNAVFNLNMTNATSGTASRVGLLLNSSTVGGSLYVTSATYTNSGINELNTMVLQNTGNVNIGTTGSKEVSFWTNNLKRVVIDLGGSIASTQSAQAAVWAPALALNLGAHTAMAASTEYPNFTIGNATQTAASGTTAIQRNAYIKRITYAGTSGTRTITDPYGLYVEDAAVGTNGALTNNYAIGADGNIKLVTAGNKLFITEGTNGSVGQTTLVSGTKTITINGTYNAVTTNSRCFATLVSQGGTVTTTIAYGCACTANTVTITALDATKATVTTDTSTVNYWIVN